ncbi:MAG TPA: pyridoxine 5'-phosphate oxidase C-terminal domain-containing protein [Acidothermaceae bacterium]
MNTTPTVRSDARDRPPTWTLYAVVADTVEFWQANEDRQHVRVQYRRDGDRWTHTMLWP